MSTEMFAQKYQNADIKFSQEVYRPKFGSNVRLQRRHKLTDNVATDQWRHPQSAVPVHTTQ